MAWKKIITSGSDASLNKLNVKNSITASAYSGDGSGLSNTGIYGGSGVIYPGTTCAILDASSSFGIKYNTGLDGMHVDDMSGTTYLQSKHGNNVLEISDFNTICYLNNMYIQFESPNIHPASSSVEFTPNTGSVKMSVNGQFPKSTLNIIDSNITKPSMQRGLFLENRTAATNAVRSQLSPACIWGGSGWLTSGTGSARSVHVMSDVLTHTGSSVYGTWRLRHSVQNNTFKDSLTVNGLGKVAINYTGSDYVLRDYFTVSGSSRFIGHQYITGSVNIHNSYPNVPILNVGTIQIKDGSVQAYSPKSILIGDNTGPNSFGIMDSIIIGKDCANHAYQQEASVIIGNRSRVSASFQYYDLIIGHDNLTHSSNGSENIVIGHGIITNGEIGTGNVVMGVSSLGTNTDVNTNNNVILGSLSAINCNTVYDTVAIGSAVMTVTTKSVGNTIIGARAAHSLSGSGNIILGCDADIKSALYTMNNSLIIMSSSQGFGSKPTPTIFGNLSTRKIGINTTGSNLILNKQFTVNGTSEFIGNQYITGSVNISGTVTATVKSFSIPHQTQPTKQLVYGVSESPEHTVFYRGKLVDNSIIQLPDEWEWLVDTESITVQLTPMDTHQQLFINKIENNKIYVGSGTNHILRCHYLVHGERKDVPKLINIQ